MSFSRELSHLVEEQIRQASFKGGSGDGGMNVSVGSGDGKVALLEANLQRLTEQVAKYMATQKMSQRNMVDYGLEVMALHGLKLAVTAGRAIFTESEGPRDLPFMYVELSRGGIERQIRYIYLTGEGVLLESTTDPSNMGSDYLPLAMVDVWSQASEITQDRIQDLRPRAGSVSGEEQGSSNHTGSVVGNVSLHSPDTGSDSFVIAATEPASLQVQISSGRALVDGEIIDAEGGQLDLSNHRRIQKEFIALGDGETTEYLLYHEKVSEVVIYLDQAVAADVVVESTEGKITFEQPPEVGVPIYCDYSFGGNYVLVFLVEKVKTNQGKPLGILNWAVGSNRNSAEPPTLYKNQHVIGKMDLSGSVEAIVDGIIDNSYEVSNLTQEDLQYGEKLGELSLQDGAITARKIVANSITGDHIAAGSIDAAKIKAGAIDAQHITAGAIQAQHIGTNTITADMIQGGTITAEKFEDATWGDLSQAMRYVKSALKGASLWRRAFSKEDLALGTMDKINYEADEFPTLRLETQRRWDQYSEGEFTLEFSETQLSTIRSEFEQYLQKELLLSRASDFDLVVNYFYKVLDDPTFEEYRSVLEDWHNGLFYVVNLEENEVAWTTSSTPFQDYSENITHTDSVEKYVSKMIDYWTWHFLNSNRIKSILYLETTYPSTTSADIRLLEIPKQLFKKYIGEIVKIYIGREEYEVLNPLLPFQGYLRMLKDYAEELPINDENIKNTISSLLGDHMDLEITIRKVADILYDAIPFDNLIITTDKDQWDYGNWDCPVYKNGYWESPSIDYGKIENLQAEFWIKPLLLSDQHSIKVKFRYSSDNVTWTGYEEAPTEEKTMGYRYWAGNFQEFRYFKVHLELSTEDENEYAILGYPEVRLASVQMGSVGDIRFPALTVKQGELKMNGAELFRDEYPYLWSWALENQLLVSDERWHQGYQGYFSVGNGNTTFRLPDTRGEFFRVLDEGRGIDPNREYGTSQGDAIRNIAGIFNSYGLTDGDPTCSGPFYNPKQGHKTSQSYGSWASRGIGFDASLSVPTSDENRPHNLAYFACIRYS